MSILRAKVVAAIKSEAERNWNLDLWMMLPEEFDRLADNILASPEIAEALSASDGNPKGGDGTAPVEA